MPDPRVDDYAKLLVDRCVDVLGGFGYVSIFDGQTLAEGVGCFVDVNNDPMRVTNPLTTQAAKDPTAQRVCACAL